VPAGSVHEKPRVTELPPMHAAPVLPVSESIVTVGFTLSTVMEASSGDTEWSCPSSTTRWSTTVLGPSPKSSVNDAVPWPLLIVAVPEVTDHVYDSVSPSGSLASDVQVCCENSSTGEVHVIVPAFGATFGGTTVNVRSPLSLVA
jgi:hypothetical protein